MELLNAVKNEQLNFCTFESKDLSALHLASQCWYAYMNRFAFYISWNRRWLAGWLLSCRRRSLYLLLIWSVEYGILERKNRDRFSFALLANCRFIHLWPFYIPHISKLVRWLNRCLFCNLTDLRYIHLTIYKFCMPFCNTLMLNGNVELCHNVWNSIDDFAATTSVIFHFFFFLSRKKRWFSVESIFHTLKRN